MKARLIISISCSILWATAAWGADVNLPAGATFTVSQRPDPALIEHFALANFISWEIFINNLDPLTLTGGTATFYDEEGAVLMEWAISPTLFEQMSIEFPVISPPDPPTPQIVVGPDGAAIPAGSSIGFAFPFETIGHNVVPASIDMTLCFDEYTDGGGGCDPLEILGVDLVEYRAPHGQAYSYPLGASTAYPTGTYGIGGHDFLHGHRFAFNQRYAYDIGLFVAGSDRIGVDDTNPDFYIYGEPVYAIADGVVVVAEKGHPENPTVGTVLPGAGACESQRCDGLSPPCGPGEFPGSGNQIVLLHDNGEYSTMAHMQTGSNDHLDCGDFVQRGDLLGMVGNVGTSGAPHLHFSSLNMPSPEDSGAISFPMYFNNIEFASPGGSPRRQLDVGVPTGAHLVILAPPMPLPQNPPLPTGAVLEVEPNDFLHEHVALTYPTSVAGTAEAADVGDLAVRGDAIEDIYRIDVTQPDSLRIELLTLTPTENLDVYVLSEDLRVLNDTRQGSRATGSEQVCVELETGAYYIMVTNVDPTDTDADYVLVVDSVPQTIACTIDNPGSPIEVDASCEAVVEFTITTTDNCCLDPDSLALDVTVSNPTANATVGPVQLDSPVVVSENEIVIHGSVVVSALTSCPAQIDVDASVSDCSGNVVDTLIQGTTATAVLVDTLAPEVTCTVTLPVLWSPNHKLHDVGLTVDVSDACDTGVVDSLVIQVWCDETEVPEAGDGTGRHAPDAKDIETGLLLRSERRGREDGRVYLIVAEATDTCGNVGYGVTSVVVPKTATAPALLAVLTQAAVLEAECLASPGVIPTGLVQIGLSQEMGPFQ